MQAESKWKKRFKFEGSPDILFLCTPPPPSKKKSIRLPICRHARSHLTVRQQTTKKKRFFSMTLCCCAASASCFSILILSSFLSNHFAPHQFPCSTKPPFSWSTIVALSLSLSRSLSLYATCVSFLFPTSAHTNTLPPHKGGRCGLYYFLRKLILNPVLVVRTAPHAVILSWFVLRFLLRSLCKLKSAEWSWIIIRVKTSSADLGMTTNVCIVVGLKSETIKLHKWETKMCPVK